jgi:hypothetical protein
LVLPKTIFWEVDVEDFMLPCGSLYIPTPEKANLLSVNEFLSETREAFGRRGGGSQDFFVPVEVSKSNTLKPSFPGPLLKGDACIISFSFASNLVAGIS